MNRRYYCLLIVLFFAVLIQAAAAERTYNILFIQSYTSQTPWHSDLNQGLVKGFKESGLKVNITTEYLEIRCLCRYRSCFSALSILIWS